MSVECRAMGELRQEVERRLSHHADWPADQMASLLERGHWGGNPHLLMLTVAAALELDDRLSRSEKPINPSPMMDAMVRHASTASPTSESICENGVHEKLARGIYDRLRNGRSGLIWAVHWPDLPPEISRRWVEAVAGAMAERGIKA